VKGHRQPGEVYLIPVNVPKPGAGARGIVATDFTPPPRPNQAGMIPVDLQRFRLYTGAAIYVDFKSVPYKDLEVVEWRRRLDWSQHIYEQSDWDKEPTILDLVRNGITHVVSTSNRDIQSPRMERVYRDAHYSVYRVRL
jgi:hypothetical protein